MWKSAAGAGGVLTATQRGQLYNSGNGLAYASMDYAPINLTTIPTTVYWGSRNDGTLQGDMTFAAPL